MNHDKLKGIKGFTLIELMIVVAIVGVISAIAIPKFGELISRSKESTAVGALGTFRSALDIYYVDQEGVYPNSTDVLVTGGYIDFLPKVQIPNVVSTGFGGHPSGSTVENYANSTLFGNTNEGSNMWAYVNDLLSTDAGYLGFNCTHSDSKGSLWSSF